MVKNYIAVLRLTLLYSTESHSYDHRLFGKLAELKHYKHTIITNLETLRII